MSISIHQLLSGFADGDAISHNALTLQSEFRKRGFNAEIFADPQHTSSVMREKCKPLDLYRGTASELVIHHYGIASPAMETYLSSPARRILIYHNITPPHYFAGFDDRVEFQLKDALRRLPEVVSRSHACWADSAFNAQDLVTAGFPNPRVFPLVFSTAGLDAPEDVNVTRKFTRKLATWLFVGRIAPNKRVEALIDAFYWYHRTINPFSRLVIIGSDRSCPAYFDMLRMLVGDYDLPNVCFEGFASPWGLSSYYRVADVFVSTSEHEGYCLPLLEAMFHGVPVIAHAIGGMPEAMNNAGVLYKNLDGPQLAFLVDKIISDSAIRSEVLASQSRRMEEVKKRDIAGELDALLADFTRELL